MITERQVTAGMSDEWLVSDFYTEAFPRNERIPWLKLLSLAPRMPLDFTAYYDDGRFVGLTVVYLREKVNWFWYFAVTKERRGQGLGQQIISRLLAKNGDKPIILDMESLDQPCDNIAQRLRRLRFYDRNGFHDTGVRRRFGDLEFAIMMCGDAVFTLDDFNTVLSELHAFWDEMPEAD